MEYREFGATGLRVSEIGFGCSRIGGVFAGADGRREALAALSAARDAGVNLFDTADMYSQGESEALVGEAFRGCRDSVIIATKGGYCLPAQRRLIARIKPLVRPVVRALGLRRASLPSAVAGALAQDFSADYLVQALHASLRRLKTDYVDLYQAHSPPSATIASGELVSTLDRLRHEGKARFIGVAADTVEDALACLRYAELDAVQFPFGLLDLEALDELLPAVPARRIAAIARGCYGGGLLKESLSDQELRDLTPKWPRVTALRALASSSGRSVLALALQFALRTPGVSVTLLGMRTSRHVADNLALYSVPPLTDEEYEMLQRVARDTTAPTP